MILDPNPNMITHVVLNQDCFQDIMEYISCSTYMVPIWRLNLKPSNIL